MLYKKRTAQVALSIANPGNLPYYFQNAAYQKGDIRMEYKNDLLARDQYISQIEYVIQNSALLKRQEDSETFVVAVDSGWGTGKTYFFHYLQEFLENIPQKDSDLPAYRVVRYNSWKNDFWDNAFEPLAEAILNDDIFLAKETDEEVIREIKTVLGNALNAGKHIAIGIVAKQLEKHVSEEALNKAGEALTQPGAKTFSAYKQFKDSIVALSEFLNDYLETYFAGGKLVVFIDELDRCKPTFAVQTLEIIKHMLNVPNLVVIFATDISQLQHTVAKVYGDKMDAQGYLMRFFDYYSRLPAPPLERYIKNSLQVSNPAVIITDKFSVNDQALFIEYYLKIANKLQLSLRDIDTISNSFVYISMRTLYKYECVLAHILYLHYLVLKYKRPDLYQHIQDSGYRWSEQEKELSKPYLGSSYSNLTTSEYFSFNLYSNMFHTYQNGNAYVVSDVKQVLKEKYRPKGISLGKDVRNNITITNKVITHNKQNGYSETSLDGHFTISDLIYEPDVARRNEFHKYTVGQFIHLQLEGCEFPLLPELVSPE